MSGVHLLSLKRLPGAVQKLKIKPGSAFRLTIYPGKLAASYTRLMPQEISSCQGICLCDGAILPKWTVCSSLLKDRISISHIYILDWGGGAIPLWVKPHCLKKAAMLLGKKLVGLNL